MGHQLTTTTPPLTFNHEGVLKKKSLRMIPFTHPANKIDDEDTKIKDMGKFYMIKETAITHYF